MYCVCNIAWLWPREVSGKRNRGDEMSADETTPCRCETMGAVKCPRPIRDLATVPERHTVRRTGIPRLSE